LELLLQSLYLLLLLLLLLLLGRIRNRINSGREREDLLQLLQGVEIDRRSSASEKRLIGMYHMQWGVRGVARLPDHQG
jgi:hypothetical protein